METDQIDEPVVLSDSDGAVFRRVDGMYQVRSSRSSSPGRGRRQTTSWSEAMVGKVRDFNGIKAPWMAQLDMKAAGPVAATTPYEPMTIAREKFRVVTLEEELIETPENGVDTIMADEFFNVHDCTGAGQMNYQP